MKVLVEQHQIIPIHIIGVPVVLTMTRPPSLFIWQKQRHNTPAELKGHITQAHQVSRPSGALDHEFVTIEIIIPFQSLDEEIVHWKTREVVPGEKIRSGLSSSAQ